MAVKLMVRSDLPCILIDASYYVFYRYFDTWKRYKQLYSQPSQPPQELHLSPRFLHHVYQDIDNDILEMRNHWQTTHANIIFCRDCSRRTIWRNDHTENYKTQRPVKELFNPNMFSILTQYCKDRRYQELYMDKMEADDIISLTKTRLRTMGFYSDIIIITNDNDYLQLLDDQTHAYNMNHDRNNLRLRSAGSPEKDLLVKILMGDRSDNIPPVRPHLGPKKALKLAMLPGDELDRYLERHNCKDAFERNRRLVDLQAIREDIQDVYHKNIDITVTIPMFKVY